jgi:hypothetical protein
MLKINKTAATSYSPTSKLVIIECKNLFNKYMVDKKILQLTEIHKILEECKVKQDSDSKVYTQMIKQEKIDKLPKELYIILIGHVSQMIFQYIQKCNSGITKEEYDMYEIEEMRDSVEFKELSKRIPNFTQKCKNTLMIDYFIDKYPSEELLKKLKSNTKSYEEIQQSLEFIKGKIGYLFYDREEVTF